MSNVVTSPDLIKTLRDIDKRIRILETQEGIPANFFSRIDASAASAASGAVAALPPPLPTGDPSQSGDTTAPNAPSKPTLLAYPGAILVKWDGLDYLGGPEATDWKQTDVHLSNTSNFTPSSASKLGAINTAPGQFYVGGLVPGTRYYVRLVAVDFTGNQSGPSAQDSAIPETTAFQDVSVGTIRNTDATIFITAATTNPSPPGNLTLGSSATRVAQTNAFDGTSIYSNNSSYQSVCASSLGQLSPDATKNIKPGRYVATFYVSLDSGALVDTTVFSIGVASANGSGVTENVNSSSSNWLDVNGKAFTQNGTFFGIPCKLTVTAPSTPVQLLIRAGTVNWRLSHVTVDTDDGGIVSGQIRTEFIRDLAVVNEKVKDLAVEKIKAGTINAALGISTQGQIYAGTTVPNPFGTSVYMDYTGIHGRNSGGSTFDLNSSDGSAVFRGTITASIINGGTINSATLNSNTINAGTITGAQIQTDIDGNSRIALYDAAGGRTALRFYTGNTLAGEIRSQGGRLGVGIYVNSSIDLGATSGTSVININGPIWQYGRRQSSGMSGGAVRAGQRAGVSFNSSSGASIGFGQPMDFVPTAVLAQMTNASGGGPPPSGGALYTDSYSQNGFRAYYFGTVSGTGLATTNVTRDVVFYAEAFG